MRTELGIVDGGIGLLGSCDDNGNCGSGSATDDFWSGIFGGGGYYDDSGGYHTGTNLPTPNTSSSGSSSAGSIFSDIANIFKPIIASQFPAIPEGSVLIQGPNGQQFIRYASGQQVPYNPTQATIGVTGSGGSSFLMIGAVALIALVALKKN